MTYLQLICYIMAAIFAAFVLAGVVIVWVTRPKPVKPTTDDEHTT